MALFNNIGVDDNCWSNVLPWKDVTYGLQENFDRYFDFICLQRHPQEDRGHFLRDPWISDFYSCFKQNIA